MLLPGCVVSVLTVRVLGDRNVDCIDCEMVWLQRSTREKRNATVTRRTSQMTGLRRGERRMGEIVCMVVVVVVVVEREKEWSAYIYLASRQHVQSDLRRDYMSKTRSRESTGKA